MIICIRNEEDAELYAIVSCAEEDVDFVRNQFNSKTSISEMEFPDGVDVCYVDDVTNIYI